MPFNYTLPVRITQALLAVTVLGLTGYVANWWSGYWHSYSPSEINFLLFASVWTVLSLNYLVIAPWKFPGMANKFGILAAEALTMIFWFGGFIALAVFLGGRVCYGHVCSVAKAATAFAAFEWLVFAGTFTMAALHIWRTRGSTPSKPQMAAYAGA